MLVLVFLEFNGIFYYVIVYGNMSLFKVEENNGVLYFYIKILFYCKGVFWFWIKGVKCEVKEKKKDFELRGKEEI